MSEDIAIHVEQLGKTYQIFDKPSDRMKQFLVPKLTKLVGGKSNSYFREFRALETAIWSG